MFRLKGEYANEENWRERNNSNCINNNCNCTYNTSFGRNEINNKEKSE